MYVFFSHKLTQQNALTHVQPQQPHEPKHHDQRLQGRLRCHRHVGHLSGHVAELGDVSAVRREPQTTPSTKLLPCEKSLFH